MNESALSSIEVKHQMMSLWKSVFHDTDEYISLVFNTYFNPELVEYELYNGEIVSALMAIPYSFCIGNNHHNDINNKCCVDSNSEYNIGDNSDDILRGLYLCGLSTNEKYRSNGIMSKLIDRINIKASKLGYAVTFLIPASGSLGLYYRNKMYEYCCYKSYLRYVEGYNFIRSNILDEYFDRNYNCVYRVVDILNVLRSGYDIETISVLLHKFICDCCNCRGNIYMYKSVDDIRTIVNENILSDNYCLLLTDDVNDIKGVLFGQNSDRNVVLVQYVMSLNSNGKNMLLQHLQNIIGSHKSIIVADSNTINGNKIFSPYRETYSPGISGGVIESHEEVIAAESLQKPFAMARITKLAEVLKFAAALYPDRKYSILVSEADLAENCGFFEVKKGAVSHTPLATLSPEDLLSLEQRVSKEQNVYHLTLRELEAVIWRHPSDSIVDSVIEIPRLPLDIYLMLE